MEHIVIVDDEPMVLKAIGRLLRLIPCVFDGQRYELELHPYTDPLLALHHVKSHAVSMVLSDYRMPEMDGVSLLSECLAQQPSAIRLIISGYADLDALVAAINRAQIYRFISKPWRDYELVTTLAQALRHRQLMLENQKLADICRLQMKTLSAQDRELKRLEEMEPGITKVRWGPDGSILLSEDQE